jgi:hypothetical protein
MFLDRRRVADSSAVKPCSAGRFAWALVVGVLPVGVADVAGSVDVSCQRRVAVVVDVDRAVDADVESVVGAHVDAAGAASATRRSAAPLSRHGERWRDPGRHLQRPLSPQPLRPGNLGVPEHVPAFAPIVRAHPPGPEPDRAFASAAIRYMRKHPGYVADAVGLQTLRMLGLDGLGACGCGCWISRCPSPASGSTGSGLSAYSPWAACSRRPRTVHRAGYGSRLSSSGPP